ncbi:MAG: L,D-transpeptidase family protein [Clostridia bacterium]|nr:L,D-transpeptidase family protein [Clostridia bacterium]
MKKYLPFILAGVVILITLILSIIVLNIPKEEQVTIAQIKEGVVERNVVNTESGDTIIVEIEEVDEATEEELEPIDEEKIKAAAEKNISTDMYYYIEVNCTAQVVTVYKKDENDNYTIPVRSMICSTGRSTPSSGIYKLPGRRSIWRALYGGVYGHYVTNIVGAILFHSVPYTAYGDNSSLEYWEYDKLGTDASMGCVRLTVRDAKWIYENCGAGTQVEFYNDSNPGPLGRPSAKKISSYPDELRNWDPTDPDGDNPWHSYNENQPTGQQVETKPVQNETKNEKIVSQNTIKEETNTVDTTSTTTTENENKEKTNTTTEKTTAEDKTTNENKGEETKPTNETTKTTTNETTEGNTI